MASVDQALENRTLGTSGLAVSALGLGCMGLSYQLPRFTVEARRANQTLVERLRTIGEGKGATPAQLALAWLLAQAPWIVPIPGTTKARRLQENLGSAAVELTSGDLAGIGSVASEVSIVGDRYPAELEQKTNR